MFTIILIKTALLSSCYGQTDRLSELKNVFQMALQNSSSVKAAQYSVEASMKQVGVERSRYNPTFKIDATDSTGFPASSSMSDVEGLPGSPFRKGWGVALFGKQTIYDFGKTAAFVGAAKSEQDIRLQQNLLTRSKVQQLASQIYFGCTLAATELKFWQSIQSAVLQIEKEVNRFVVSGQRSVVEKELVFAQTADLKNKIATSLIKIDFSKKRLSQMAGKEIAHFDCQSLGTEETEIIFQPVSAPRTPPLVAVAQSELQATKSKLQISKTQDAPYLEMTASYGQMQSSRLIAKEDYSVAVGLVFPIWDGDKSRRERSRDQTLVAQKENEVDAADQDYKDALLRLQEQYVGAKARLSELRAARESAQKAFEVARQRYQAYAGGLSDYRESIRNLEQVTAEIAQNQIQIMESQVFEHILKGEDL